jgi:hypothetical protein
MPTIRTQCPSCRQQIDFAPGECSLLGGPDGEPVAYAFVCPHCREPIVRRADRRAAAMLVIGGASPRGAEEHVGRLPHPEEPAGGPPLTDDDLIDFHLLLDGADWFGQLAHLTGPRVVRATRSPRQRPARRDRGEPES